MMFNGEFFAHGFFMFAQVILILFYLQYVIILDILVDLYKLTARQIFFIGAGYGMIVEGFYTRSFYLDPPLIIGVNWISVFVQIIAWGLLATVMAFYFTETILPRKKYQKKGLQIFLLISTIIFMILLFIGWGSMLPPLEEQGAGAIGILVIILAILFIRTSRRSINYPFLENDKSLNKILKRYLMLEFITGMLFLPFSTIVWIITLLFLGPYVYFKKLRRNQIPI